MPHAADDTCGVLLRPLSGAVGLLESEGHERRCENIFLITEGMRSHQIIMVLLPEDVSSASFYRETRAEPNLCSSDQYQIPFTYLAVLGAWGTRRRGR